MSDKRKSVFPHAPAAKPPAPASKTKRPATVNASTSRVQIPQTAMKERPQQSQLRQKLNLNTTVLADGDTTTCNQEQGDFEPELTYRRLLRTLLEGCLVEEKIAREETELDVQMTLLAERFQKTIDHLDKSNRRLKEISFVAEQKRLIDMKNQDCSKFYEMIEKSSSEELLKDLNHKEQASLDRLEVKNIDFGYDKESGHKQLLEAVDETILGLEEIKKHSQLDANKFKEYEKSKINIQDIEKARSDLESAQREFEKKFPNFSEKLMKVASETMSKVMNSDDEDDDDDE